ncbi:MAG: LLM class flavin-dependent oxidoreductase [Actinobacteria bacterium]|nr:LLM class flavin-dependent oxidoreductase [Actinomycetota bacterium]
MIRVGIRVPVGRPIPEVAAFIARCEEAGFDGVGVHDHHHTGRDVYVTLAVAALQTTRMALYPVTSNTVTRDPLVLAALANSLWELAPGRILLSLAPGFLSVEKAGREQAGLEQVKAAVAVVRSLLAGQEVPVNGKAVRLTNVPGRPPKILLLASGPRLLEAAGEVADGVMTLTGLHPAAVARARDHLRRGALRAGRDPAGLDEVFVVPFAVGTMADTAEWPRGYFRPGRPWLSYPSATKRLWLREAGIALPADAAPEAISAPVARQICDALGLFGPAEYCAERLLRAAEETGLRDVFLFPEHTFQTGYDLPAAEVDAFRDVIKPILMKSGHERNGDRR